MEAEERLLTKNAHTKAEKIIKLRGGPHNALDSGKLSVKGRAHSGIIKTLREWDIYIYIYKAESLTKAGKKVVR